jgi:flagellar hook-basal body complex protein FliE
MSIPPVGLPGASPSLIALGSTSVTADTQTGANFGQYIGTLMTKTVHQSAAAETTATTALTQGGDLTGAVTAVAQAQLALQTGVAIRDRLISAYQSIMNMPI